MIGQTDGIIHSRPLVPQVAIHIINERPQPVGVALDVDGAIKSNNLEILLRLLLDFLDGIGLVGSDQFEVFLVIYEVLVIFKVLLVVIFEVLIRVR